ncbi:hypothetical protein BN137_3341 [Cronobacter condimenti 1330]|uniref:Uncharacterized protein n=1 Tax=Cronobacter condimenti 1330 TaxID=1073999 RepID=K8A3B2_9ENTR|nr:hypothetical protein BN137_3341 [Cronobacter condimenti 1330]
MYIHTFHFVASLIFMYSTLLAARLFCNATKFTHNKKRIK